MSRAGGRTVAILFGAALAVAGCSGSELTDALGTDTTTDGGLPLPNPTTSPRPSPTAAPNPFVGTTWSANMALPFTASFGANGQLLTLVFRDGTASGLSGQATASGPGSAVAAMTLQGVVQTQFGPTTRKIEITGALDSTQARVNGSATYSDSLSGNQGRQDGVVVLRVSP